MANLIPLHAAGGDLIGHVPNRASKNPVLGVIRCDCGEPATVHNPKGKRSGRYYTMCDKCGTDQRAGDTRQAKIRAEMVETVEQLSSLKVPAPEPVTEPEAEKQAENTPEPEPLEAAKNAAYTVNEPEEENTPDPQPQNKPIGLFAVAGALIGAVLAVAV